MGFDPMNSIKELLSIQDMCQYFDRNIVPPLLYIDEILVYSTMV